MEELLRQILDELISDKELYPTGIYTLKDLAEYFECDHGTVLKWTKNGLKHKRVGRKIYIVGKDVLEFFDDDADLSYSEGSRDRIERKLKAVKY